MELDQFKAVWLEENKRLEERVSLNEKFIRDMNFDKMVGRVEKLFNLSLTGRTLTFIYAVISVSLAVRQIGELEYSLPLLAAAATMIWSYFSHAPIKRPDYYKIPVLELQKQVCQFRIHTASHEPYDLAVVTFWILTLVPAMFNSYWDIPIYSNLRYTLMFVAGGLITVAINTWQAKRLYRK